MKIRYCVYGVILLLVTVWAKQVLAEDAVFRSKEFKFLKVYRLNDVFKQQVSYF
jgi:hypothetical protein